QEVGVADLVLEAEADQVKVRQRREGFEAAEGQAVAAQLLFEVERRRKGTFAGPLRGAVHDAVEHLQPVMTHAERVAVGEGEARLAAHPAMVLDHGVQLAAGVLGGHLNARQQPRDRFLQRRIDHDSRSRNERGLKYYSSSVSLRL